MMMMQVLINGSGNFFSKQVSLINIVRQTFSVRHDVKKNYCGV